jgi:glycosyltransferase involved in cell wall biosynthesis
MSESEEANKSNKEPKIVVQSLIKDEDLYIRNVLDNVIDFCDEMIVLDNMSTDNTYPIVEAFQKEHEHKVELHRIENFRESGQYNFKYFETNTFILSVDGDEVYDPEALKIAREQIKSGAYKKYWNISGYFLNCTELDVKNQIAKGYMSPPARPCVRLYNFKPCIRWPQRKHRMHGGKPLLRRGYNFMTSRLTMHETMTWEECPLRFLHLCFIPRSSQNPEDCRINPSEIYVREKKKKKMYSGGYKKEIYRKGDIQEIDMKPFFPNGFSINE